jgi:hypothetical protein
LLWFYIVSWIVVVIDEGGVVFGSRVAEGEFEGFFKIGIPKIKGELIVVFLFLGFSTGITVTRGIATR